MRLVLLITVVAVLIASCHGVNKILKNKDPEYKLRMAEKYYVNKKYNYAYQLFEDVVPYYKTSKEFEDIYYKMAYCTYYQRDYVSAENYFKTYLELFPNNPRAEEMDFMRAYCFYKQSPKAELDQTNTVKTIGIMQSFINTHPGSVRIKEASDIIDICHAKLETKDFKAAQLYYDLGQFRAAAVAFAEVLNNYPESSRGDEYKLMTIKSYYRYAELSVEEKKVERFEKVVEECNDFADRFPESKLSKDVEHYLNLSQTNIKNLSNEQVKTST
ncbi:MAG TPA: outer membrane protein assembly factor BamD [Chitinophagaceae bacterium]|nr:outer membrane protein assembly factor BamD [Chitinophagaceae bacterium]